MSFVVNFCVAFPNFRSTLIFIPCLDRSDLRGIQLDSGIRIRQVGLYT